jgi:hypothetical protein
MTLSSHFKIIYQWLGIWNRYFNFCRLWKDWKLILKKVRYRCYYLRIHFVSSYCSVFNYKAGIWAMNYPGVVINFCSRLCMLRMEEAERKKFRKYSIVGCFFFNLWDVRVCSLFLPCELSSFIMCPCTGAGKNVVNKYSKLQRKI